MRRAYNSLGLVRRRESGPKPSFSITPGRYGSIKTSARLQRSCTTLTPCGCFRLTAMDRLFLGCVMEEYVLQTESSVSNLASFPFLHWEDWVRGYIQPAHGNRFNSRMGVESTVILQLISHSQKHPRQSFQFSKTHYVPWSGPPPSFCHSQYARALENSVRPWE